MEKEISKIVKKFVDATFKVSIENFEFQSTKKEFEGDITLVLFPLLKQIKVNPKHLGELIGSELKSKLDIVKNCNVVSGFLNITIASSFYTSFLDKVKNDFKYGHIESKNDADLVMVEYSSPNTN